MWKLLSIPLCTSHHNLYQIGWEALVCNHFALVRPLKDICRAVLEPLPWLLSMLLGLLSCWKMNCHPSLGSRALWSRCSSRMPSQHNAAFILSSVLTILPVPAAEKHPDSMLLLPRRCFSAGMVWPDDWWVPVFGKHETWHSNENV